MKIFSGLGFSPSGFGEGRAVVSRFELALPILLAMVLPGLAAAELWEIDLHKLRHARAGQAMQLQLATNRHNIPVLPVRILPEAGPQFLFSDKPEYFPRDGFALREDVTAGMVRLYVYHVPEPAEGGKVITAVVENPGTNALTLRMLRRGFPKPGGDYQRVAKAALVKYLTARPEPSVRSIAPGGKLVLDPAMDAYHATKDELVHGFYELELSGPARISVLQRDPSRPTLEAMETLETLPGDRPGHTGASGAGRGKFDHANFIVTPDEDIRSIDTAQGPLQLVIADGKRDAWIRGHDAIEDRKAVNVGNYGVIYRIKFKHSSSDGRRLAILFSKLDVVNQYCGAVAAAMMVRRGEAQPELVPLPVEKVSLRAKGEVAVVAVLPALPEGRREDVELLYSPPGAACLPTPILFVPFD